MCSIEAGRHTDTRRETRGCAARTRGSRRARSPQDAPPLVHGAFLHARADPAVATLRLLRSRLAVLGRLMWGPQAPPGGGGAAAAAAEAAKASGGSNLYPPRDKKARKLWHDLQIFKKKSDKGMKSRELLLPPDTGYMLSLIHI